MSAQLLATVCVPVITGPIAVNSLRTALLESKAIDGVILLAVSGLIKLATTGAIAPSIS